MEPKNDIKTYTDFTKTPAVNEAVVDSATQMAMLQAQIAVLKELNHSIAFTGSLDNLQQHSYVIYSDVIALMNNKRKQLADLKANQ